MCRVCLCVWSFSQLFIVTITSSSVSKNQHRHCQTLSLYVAMVCVRLENVIVAHRSVAFALPFLFCALFLKLFLSSATHHSIIFFPPPSIWSLSRHSSPQIYRMQCKRFCCGLNSIVNIVRCNDICIPLIFTLFSGFSHSKHFLAFFAIVAVYFP